MPKIERMAFGAMTCEGTGLNPALTTPPAEIWGDCAHAATAKDPKKRSSRMPAFLQSELYARTRYGPIVARTCVWRERSDCLEPGSTLSSRKPNRVSFLNSDFELSGLPVNSGLEMLCKKWPILRETGPLRLTAHNRRLAPPHFVPGHSDLQAVVSQSLRLWMRVWLTVRRDILRPCR